MVECRAHTGRKPRSMYKWKFDVVREAILDVLKEKGEMRVRDLPGPVSERIPQEKLDALGSLKSAILNVRLEIEVRGEIIVNREVYPALVRPAKDGEAASGG